MYCFQLVPILFAAFFCSFFKMLLVQQDLVEMALPVRITGKIINAHAHLAIQGNIVKFEVNNYLSQFWEKVFKLKISDATKRISKL